MASGCRWVAVAIAIMATLGASDASLAQKKGGILRVYTNNSPASMSILEEATAAAVIPMMSVFNNLVMFDQHVKQNSLESIVLDLATGWSWSDDGKDLTFKLRQGVKWHDGKPFTAADVKCTWDMVIEASPQKFRVNPRKSSYRALEQITTNGDYEVTFHLKWPQPAFLMLLANGFSGIYPCHVPPAEMRQHPIGTGPFKFVEFRPNESIKLTRNPDYWKPGLPYLDGIEYTIIRDQATAILAFASGKVDLTFPYSLTIPLLKEVRSQVPQASCELTSTGVNRSLFVNRTAAPFDNADVRRALALAIDRKPFIDILTESQGEIGGVLQPPPEGLWGMPPDLLQELPGYAPDMLNNRAQARAIMQKLGYGPDKRLPVKISAQNSPSFRDPALILIDQLKEIFIDGELDPIETAVYFPKIRRKNFSLALGFQVGGPDPDPILDLFFGCGSGMNWDGYCNPEVDKLIEQQSREGDPERRKQLLWAIERKLAEDVARPILFYDRAGSCWQPYVKGVTVMVNSIVNGHRYEDLWLDK